MYMSCSCWLSQVWLPTPGSLLQLRLGERRSHERVQGAVDHGQCIEDNESKQGASSVTYVLVHSVTPHYP